jgi:hypothetical protein
MIRLHYRDTPGAAVSDMQKEAFVDRLIELHKHNDLVEFDISTFNVVECVYWRANNKNNELSFDDVEIIKYNKDGTAAMINLRGMQFY